MQNISKKTILVCLLIGINYAFVGTGYLTWVYHMMNIYRPETVEWFTNVLDYIFQGLGMITVYFLLKKSPQRIKRIAFISIPAEFILMTLAILFPSPYTVIFGVLMDYFCGIVLACCIGFMPSLTSGRGMVIGIGWAIGSVSTWIVSIPGDGEFIKSNYSIALYLLLAVFSILLFIFSEAPEPVKEKSVHINPDKKLIVLSVAIILLLQITISLGFLFPLSDLSDGTVHFEYSRSFYAVGLILAGFINDRSRQGGLLLCVCSLICPFLSLMLSGFTIARDVLWAMNYAFIGFLTVYCVVIFSDFAKYKLQLVVLGLMCRRFGEAFGSSIGMCLSDYPVMIIVLTAVFFVFTIIVAGTLWIRLFVNTDLSNDDVISDESPGENRLENFLEKYGISKRERDVLICVIEGQTNSGIANSLFISENTVKFHMKNLLKKTGTANRAMLCDLYKSFSSEN